MQPQHTKRADDASGRARRGHLSKVLLIGSDDAFQSGVARRIFNGHPFRIVGRSTTLLDALARLESSTIDLVLLSREFREEELSLFALDAHRRGFAGLILCVASLANQGAPDEQTRMEFNDPYNSMSFTAKQQAVLTRVSEGWTNQQIALHLKWSEGSVKAVLQELFKKLGVRKRAQIVRMAFEKTQWNPSSGVIRPGTMQRGHRK
jgi:DNA-binding NarL/FixJ family response regulator